MSGSETTDRKARIVMEQAMRESPFADDVIAALADHGLQIIEAAEVKRLRDAGNEDYQMLRKQRDSLLAASAAIAIASAQPQKEKSNV